MTRVLFLFFLIIMIFLPKSNVAQINGIKIAGDTCTSQTLNLQATGTSNSAYFFWNFGDSASGVNDTTTITGISFPPYPTHTFTSPGIYNVCVSFQEPGFQVSTVCRTFRIGLCCDAIINSTDSCLQNSIPFSLTTGGTINSVSWNFGDLASGTNNVSTSISPTHNFSSSGTYIVTATVNANCSTYTKSLIKRVLDCLPPTPCTGAILLSDSCQQSAIKFQVSSTSTINSEEWSFGDAASGINNTSSSISPSHTFSGIGTFNVTAIINFSCGTDTLIKTISIVSCNTSNHFPNCELNFPNAFSPNGDGINDFISPKNNLDCVLSEYEFLIFNRWGQLVFQTKNINQNWDGKYKHKDCPIGTFYYILNYKSHNQISENTKSGYILLIR